VSHQIAGPQLLVRDDEEGISERTVTINRAIASLLPEPLCRHHHMLALEYTDGVLLVAGDPDSREEATSAIEQESGYEATLLWTERADVDAALDELFAANGHDVDAASQLSTDGLALGEFAMAPRLGESLAAQGLITEEQLSGAIEEQQSSGGRIGQVLIHMGAIEERELQAVLSGPLGLPTVDLSAYDPAEAPRDTIREPVARRLGVVAFAADEKHLYVAVPDALGVEETAALEAQTDLEVDQFLAPSMEIEEFLREVNRDAYTQIALSNLRERFPDSSAHEVLGGGQKVALVILAVVLIGFLIWNPVGTITVIFALASIFYLLTALYKLIAGFSALNHKYLIDITQDDLAAMDERALPVYTILVPLFREAAVIPYLVHGIESLDYPKAKLDVKLLCEEDDDETIDAIRVLNLPPHFDTVVVPASQPQTKPKACNYGLLAARGEYVVIYDAEDRPDPQQLKKAVLMFRNIDESVAVIQSKLNFFNQQTNWLTRWFSIEYSLLFDLLLPGLDARKDPIPLGGTSNHIKTDVLMQVGAWDPYNVTEDADLGIRFHQAGYRTTMMDSTTYEEANTQVGSWVRQRSRWIKGYLQTWLVYMRNPFRTMGGIGFKGFVSFNLLIGGTFIFLINPFFWALTTLFALTQAGFIQELFPGWVYFLAAALLFIGNFIFVFLGLVAAVRRGDDNLALYALFLPFYWGLMSVAAWKGFAQLITNPFYWEKTEHGIDVGAAPAGSTTTNAAPAGSTTTNGVVS
jgi:cellulose synthase/poly-beta-1,6-N-acetylglucosamine synthase-like glycosyltransferase